MPRIAAHRGAQQLAATQRAHGAHGVVDRVVAGLDRARLLLERHPGARAQQLVVVEPRGGLGDPLHQLADVAGAGEHAGEALRRRGRVAQHPQEPRSVAEPLADPPEGEQAVVRVDSVGEPLDHDGHEVALDRRLAAQPARQRRDVTERAGGVREADRGEAVVRLRRRERPLLLRQGGDGGEQRAVEEPHVDVAHLALDALPRAPRPARRYRRGRWTRARARAAPRGARA